MMQKGEQLNTSRDGVLLYMVCVMCCSQLVQNGVHVINLRLQYFLYDSSKCLVSHLSSTLAKLWCVAGPTKLAS